MTTKTQSVNSTPQISKSLKYFFISLQFLIGLDFGFMRSSQKSAMYIQLYNLLHMIAVCINIAVDIYTNISRLNVFFIFWIISLLLQHCINSAILTLTANRSVYTLLNALLAIDSNLGERISFRYVEKNIILSCILSVIYRIVASLLFCEHFVDECVPTTYAAAVIALQVVSFDILLIISFFIFYTVYVRLKVFVDFVKNNDSRVLECLDVYKSIVDTVEHIKKPFDFVYALALLFLTPNLILTVYLGILKLKDHGEIDSTFVTNSIIRAFYCLQDFSLLFVPAISAGLLTHQAKVLLITLHDRLLQERSQKHAANLEVFISYVEARPMKLVIFDVIWLDWTLPVLTLNLCITYQIVVVQLTHVY